MQELSEKYNKNGYTRYTFGGTPANLGPMGCLGRRNSTTDTVAAGIPPTCAP